MDLKKSTLHLVLALTAFGLSATAVAGDLNRIAYGAPIAFGIANNVATNTTEIVTDCPFNPIKPSTDPALQGLLVVTEGGDGTTTLDKQGTYCETGKVVTDPLGWNGLHPPRHFQKAPAAQVSEHIQLEIE